MRRSRSVEIFLLVAVASALAACAESADYRCTDEEGNWVADDRCSDPSSTQFTWVATSGGSVGARGGGYGGTHFGGYYGGFGGGGGHASFGG